MSREDEMPCTGRNVNDHAPNFRNKDDKLFLVRCFACGGEYGKENWAMAVAGGQCCWCGWSEEWAAKHLDKMRPEINEKGEIV